MGAVLIILLGPNPVHALTKHEALAEIRQIAPGAGLALAQDGTPLLLQNADRLYVPASCIKIPLTLAALTLLGEDFRFATTFYRDGKNNLLIRGQGDPFLVSEELALIARQLTNKGYRHFNQLHLDNSLYARVQLPGGDASDNPYDAQFHALFVNFNTVNLRLDRKGKVASAEEQTPTLPFMQGFASKLQCCEAERINIGKDRQVSNRYTAELIHAIFAKQGISFQRRSFATAQLGKGWQLIYTHHNSRDLPTISRAMLHYSTNIIANAMLLQFAHAKKRPLQAALTKWRRMLRPLLSAEQMDELRFYEGAGLDRRNRLSPRTMLALVQHFRPHKHLLRFDEVTGASYKTGTLTGVCNAAGFLKNGRAFVVFTESCPRRDQIIALLARID